MGFSPPQRESAQRVRAWLAHYALKRDLVTLGAIRPGADPLLDQALQKLPAIERLLRQERHEASEFSATLEAITRF